VRFSTKFLVIPTRIPFKDSIKMASIISPLQAFSADIGGIWTIESEPANSSNAETLSAGTIQLDPFGQLYQTSWLADTGSRMGFAFYVDRYLVGGWGYEPNYRLSLFHIQADGTLEGYWALPTSWGAIARETAKPDLTDGLDGLYDVDGIDVLTRKPRASHLSIRRDGNLYRLGSTQFPNAQGLGLRLGDWLITNWCGTRGFGVMAYEVSDGEAQGGWVSPKDDQFHPEVLIKVG
jgi:hypothetical protein